jgi:hypothetical protein
MRALPAILAMLLCASPSPAISVKLIGAGAPKVTLYRPCETQAIVYDARPEMGISFEYAKPYIGALNAIGVRVARVVLELNLMEAADRPGLYDAAYLAKWDKLVEDARSLGVCLDVVIKGDPGSIDTKYSITAPQRLARFAADMAARYPSVAYWEVPEDMYPGLSGSRSDIAPLGGGKMLAGLLKAVYPAVKLANPAAQVVFGVWSVEFAKGVYEDGGQRLFDVACVKTDANNFATNAADLRAVMAANGDETKPLWCVFTDGLDRSALEAAFATNNEAQIYAKVLVESTGLEQAAKWLSEARVNGAIEATPRSTLNVFVPTKRPMIPLGYEYKTGEGGIEIQRVVIDSLVPTAIQLRYAGEPPPAKPGAKPAKPQTDSRHTPDPFDI